MISVMSRQSSCVGNISSRFPLAFWYLPLYYILSCTNKDKRKTPLEEFKVKFYFRCNMSKTSASVSAGVSNTEKQMKARGRRPSAFIVSRCLEPLMKHEARVFDMTSQSRLKIQCNKACKNNVFPAGMVNSSCKSLPVFRKPFVPC